MLFLCLFIAKKKPQGLAGLQKMKTSYKMTEHLKSSYMNVKQAQIRL